MTIVNSSMKELLSYIGSKKRTLPLAHENSLKGFIADLHGRPETTKLSHLNATYLI